MSEDPLHIAVRKVKEHRVHPPPDILDGAARVVDSNSGEPVWGKFLQLNCVGRWHICPLAIN